MSKFVGRISAEDLYNFCFDSFSKVGVSRKGAKIVSDHLVVADLRGVDSHGALFRMPRYLSEIEKGLINPKPKIKLVKETASTALMDGDNCLGQVAAMKATELAIKKAKATGVGIIGATNINHVGSLAYYMLKVVSQALIGFALTVTDPTVAPWGGRKRIFGTNPLSISFPIDEKTSIILDMATSASSEGKIAVAAARNEKIPRGVALDKNGGETTGPKAYFDGGALLPFGGYKGYGLSLSVEILAGVLIGPRGMHIRPSWASQGGFLIEVIGINRFKPHEKYKEEMLNLKKSIKSCPLAEGFKEILLPGERASREHRRRLKEGIPVDEESWDSLKKISGDLGIKLPALTKDRLKQKAEVT